jgi:hypothetical protein
MKRIIKFKKALRLYHTLKYLKQKQFTFRFYYFFRSKIRKLTQHKYPTRIAPLSTQLKLTEHQAFNIYDIYKKNKFTFIGISHEFQNNEVDWNHNHYGKLWNYNLTYFDFLQQKDMNKEISMQLIKNFINYPEPIRGKKMPFPISLRNINFIKFISKKKIKDKEVNTFIFNQYSVLMDNLEYHILGNHLLENAFSLLFGAYYFKDENLYFKAKNILTTELNEQILKDGAHFERTPMYHQIMLFRILDCINLVENNAWKNQELLKLLTVKAEVMLGWLTIITYKNGDIPLLNDSAKGIAPTSEELFEYAETLNLKSTQVRLSDSGYRKKITENYECIMDVGNIGSDYIPGHAHSDTFNFELHVNNQPVIVDTGISTYETNEQRTLERSTSSHNTVEIDHNNQTNVWGGFRVAKRAKITNIIETKNTIQASHDGYKHQGYMHTRKWSFFKNKINIGDTIEGKTPKTAIAYLHFHPNINIKIRNNIIITPLIKIHFDDILNLSISRYNFSNSFNHKILSNVVIINFKKSLSMEITIQ